MGLEGKIVRLREERPEDMKMLTEMRNDLETQAWNQTLPPDYTERMHQQRFEKREFSYQPKEGRFIVVMKETGEVAGSILYSSLTSRWEATLGIMLAKEFWGTGAAYDASEVLLRFMFVELGLRVVRLWTQGGNQRAIGLAEKSGFKVSLRQREAAFRGGQRVDNISMDLLREEYFVLRPELEDDLSPL